MVLHTTISNQWQEQLPIGVSLVTLPTERSLNKLGKSMSDTELLLLVEARKKSRFVAILLNLFIPGAGYVYCGRWVLGLLALWFTVVLWVQVGWPVAILLIFVLVIDGALCVGRYNRKMTEQLIMERAQAKAGGAPQVEVVQ
jgi:TM2 domain-containing membrane protein YozV